MRRKLLAGGGILLVVLILVAVIVTAVPMAVFATVAVDTPQDLVVTAITATYTAMTNASDGVDFANNGRVFIHVKSTYTALQEITIVTAKTYRGYALADQTFEIPASGESFIGPFPADVFNDSSGNVNVQAVGAVFPLSFTVAAIRY
ncbi:hypothetical protein LCGC14_0712040 [marine sediment metagenome]|uniref:Uncharacterized protein n=1 Tax=marine sediment metagenome TaxID=412755 RepID=A0A0F9QJ90_9ZZZZ